ncbi:MAG: hypothetical protein K1X75_10800 [Leptospirales bacterium]|nr:hypothetical protein [Leptospirales bacterium]
MIAAVRLGALLCSVAFGSQFVASTVRDSMLANLRHREEAHAVSGFVTLSRAQTREDFLGQRYYFSYHGIYDGVSVIGVERVSSQFFHRNTEGKNAEARFYRDDGGVVYARLFGDETEENEGKNFLTRFSILACAFFALLGLAAWLLPAGKHALE